MPTENFHKGGLCLGSSNIYLQTFLSRRDHPLSKILFIHLIKVEVGIQRPIRWAFLLLFEMIAEAILRTLRIWKAKLRNHSSRVHFHSFSYRCYEVIGMKQIHFHANQHHLGEVTSAFFTLDPVWILSPKALCPLSLYLFLTTPIGCLLLLLLMDIPKCSYF